MSSSTDEARLIEEGSKVDTPIFRLEFDQRVKQSPDAMTIVQGSRQSAAKAGHDEVARMTDGEVFLVTLDMLDRHGPQESVDLLTEIARPFFEDGDLLKV
jgi:hypothetical protein